MLYIHSVTSYALPWMITQHDSRLLCLATSAPVRLPPRFSSLRFMFTAVVLLKVLGLPLVKSKTKLAACKQVRAAGSIGKNVNKGDNARAGRRKGDRIYPGAICFPMRQVIRPACSSKLTCASPFRSCSSFHSAEFPTDVIEGSDILKSRRMTGEPSQ